MVDVGAIRARRKNALAQDPESYAWDALGDIDGLLEVIETRNKRIEYLDRIIAELQKEKAYGR